jgi:hypothetical protein
LEFHQKFEENDAPSYELEGLESLGSMLRLVVRNNVSLSNASVQWFRVQPEGSKTEIISGRNIFILHSAYTLLFAGNIHFNACCH